MSPLWIVSTPIGNLEDLAPRARAVLSAADLVLAEDTRRTGLLFAQCGIKPKKMFSFHEHNEEERQADILALLKENKDVALVSDAGTPLLADPGYRLVRECRKLGIKVSPVPGPSAPVTALSAAGIPPLPFTFLGFLPRGANNCRETFLAFANVPGSLIFFERKDRLEKSLALAYEIFGPRELAICRELTKLHEEFIISRLEDHSSLTHPFPGEITVIIGPPEKKQRAKESDALEIVEKLLKQGLKPRKAAIEAARQCAGWSTGELYKLAISSRGL